MSIPGVYVGFPDKLPFGAAMNEGLTLKMGQTPMQKYMKPLLEKIQAGAIDPSQVITHRVPLSLLALESRRAAPRSSRSARLARDGKAGPFSA